jgi:hypothetical protein
MNKEIPTVIIHFYNAKPQNYDYARHTIKQACAQKNKVFTLMDYVPEVEHSLHQHLNVNELLDTDSMLFVENYVHMSTNYYNFERACMLRLFIMKAFMRKFNYEKIFHIDSDVLLYANIDSIAPNYKNYDFTLTNNQHSANSFFTLPVLEDICEKLLKTYVDKENYFWWRYMTKIYNKMLADNKKGGICDMTFLNHYKTLKECNNKFSCGEMTDIINGCRFDHLIKHSEESFNMREGIKNIEMREKIPFCYNNKLKTEIQFLSLHFQGNTKDKLQDYVTYN